MAKTITLKHDTEKNWKKAVNFTPKKGEIIIYDADNNITYQRLKIGDGVTVISDLPFYTDNAFSWNKF